VERQDGGIPELGVKAAARAKVASKGRQLRLDGGLRVRDDVYLRGRRGPRRAGLWVAQGRHAAAGLGLESEPGARSGMNHTGRARLAVRERGREEEREADWAAGPRKRRKGGGEGNGPGQEEERRRERNASKYI
jgi:hypothetical protein